MVTDLVLRTFIALQGIGSRTRDDDDGQTLAEYSLIMSTIAVAVVVTSVIVFRAALADAWNTAAECLSQLAPCN
jgi:Flp pilus assembly pilin Flp